MNASRSIYLLGCRLDLITWRDLKIFCEKSLLGKLPRQIVTLNGEIALTASRHQLLLKVINEADLVVADSINVVLASYLKYRRLPTRIPGVDIVDLLCAVASEMGYRVFLLGGRAGIGERAAAKLKDRHKNLIIAGVSAADPNNTEAVKKIKDSRADIVLVAYGSPKQELWIARHKKSSGAKILIGVGGALDMIANILPRAPLLLRKLGLEWLWRLILQPKRIKRVWKAVVIFPLAVLSRH